MKISVASMDRSWEKTSSGYKKVFWNKEKYHFEFADLLINKESLDLLENGYCCAYFVLAGSLSLNGEQYKCGDLLYFSKGERSITVISDGFRCLYIESEQKLAKGEAIPEVYREKELPWSAPLKEGTSLSKHMLKPETHGLKLQVGMYTKGFTQPLHSHSVDHCFYILEGMMETEENGTKHLYGPNECFVGDKNIVFGHQEEKDCDHVKFLFIANGVFDYLIDGVNYYR